jgi:hypothetical protein
MLKYTNIILGIAIAIGIIYSSQIIPEEPVVVEEAVRNPGFTTPLPGAEGDQWEEFNEYLGSIQDSTDQEQE